MLEAVLQLHHVTLARAGQTIACGVNVSVRPGEMVAIIGANGAGKSTLLGAMAGSIRPQVGQVLLAGRPIDGYGVAELARARGYLPQSLPVQTGWRVKDFIALGRHPHGVGVWHPRRERDERAILEASSATGVLAWLERPLDSLSGGQRQRVFLAQVLAQHAPVLLLDEPTTFLDWHGQVTFMQTLQAIRTSQDLTIVTVLHDLNLAAQFFERVIVLAPGEGIVADGAAADVLSPLFVQRVFGIRVHRQTHPDTGMPYLVAAQDRPGDDVPPIGPTPPGGII